LWRSITEQINAYRTGFQARARTMSDTADELSCATFNRDTGQWMGGATVDTADIEALGPWLDWAWDEMKSA
jgi:hypothetical protein